jgi:hypothetical protein
MFVGECSRKMRLIRRLFTAILAVVLLSGTADVLAADDTAFKDHWAAATLRRALDDTLISATDGDILPDEALTGGKLISILCRVLSASREADLSGVTDMDKSDPYYKAAAQALALGLISPRDGRLNLEQPITRSGAFSILANAFQLTGARSDTSMLDKYSDSDTLFGDYRMAAAALTSNGFVIGSGGLLHMSENISLAEFLTILYRIIPNYHRGGTTAPGGSVVSGNDYYSWTKFQDSLYYDCTTSHIALQGLEAPCVVVRSSTLDWLSVFSCHIDRLVIAAGAGTISFTSESNSDIGTVAVGDGGGAVTLRGTFPSVEITGDGRTVDVEGNVQKLLISGQDCKVKLSQGSFAGSVTILSTGSGSRLTVNGSCNECVVYGASTTVDGSGSIQSVTDNGKNSTITAKSLTKAVNDEYGLTGTSLSISAPDSLPSYMPLNATVDIKAPDSDAACIGYWYLDDVLISASDVILGKTASASLSYSAKNQGSEPVTAALSFVLYSEDPDGGWQELRTGKNIILENTDKFHVADVLGQVTTGYAGDFTLKWAQTHDYDDSIKTAWVNYKGYSSKTDYLVWVNITYQRVNIFTGSAGSWKLDRSFLVGTGAPGKDTPVGSFKVIGRSTAGWTTKEYTVKPVVFFNTYGYGFHSRLYYPKTTNILDSRIGFPISHGCVRMYDQDVDWFYKTIPTGTTVVVY